MCVCVAALFSVSRWAVYVNFTHEIRGRSSFEFELKQSRFVLLSTYAQCVCVITKTLKPHAFTNIWATAIIIIIRNGCWVCYAQVVCADTSLMTRPHWLCARFFFGCWCDVIVTINRDRFFDDTIANVRRNRLHGMAWHRIPTEWVSAPRLTLACVRAGDRPFPPLPRAPGLRCVSCYIQCEHILVTRGGAEFMFAKAHPPAWRPTCTRVCSPLANRMCATRPCVCRMVTPTRPSGYKTKYRRALKSGRCVFVWRRRRQQPDKTATSSWALQIRNFYALEFVFK